MSAIRFPRMISDGMIVQKNKKACIRGYVCAGQKVKVTFDNPEEGRVAEVIADANGYFEAFVDPSEPGGPYSVIVETEDSRSVINNVLVGNVFVITGQSNMEFPMRRVRDTYPEEFNGKTYDYIRDFKIAEHTDFHGSLDDHLTGEWSAVTPDTLPPFSAVGYFFAKYLLEKTGEPVGLINASLGGASIQSWMGRDMLSGLDDEIAEADRYADDEYMDKVLKQNESDTAAWLDYVECHDLGDKEHWEKLDANKLSDDLSWGRIDIPCRFRETKLRDFIGRIWLSKEFCAPKELADTDAVLWFGTMTDADEIFVNGVGIGRTEYCYPPRRYPIPKGLIHEGSNTVTVKLNVEKGRGRITPGKIHAIFSGDVVRYMEDGVERIEGAENYIELDGEWFYRIGTKAYKRPETDFVSQHATGLFNGMLAPCKYYPIKAVLWYQGETNAHTRETYYDLSKRQIEGFRRMWNDETLPYYFAQLPEFDFGKYDENADEGSIKWDELKKIQEKIATLPYTYMLVTDGTGEINDLHPQRKKPVGEGFAKLVLENEKL